MGCSSLASRLLLLWWPCIRPVWAARIREELRAGDDHSQKAAFTGAEAPRDERAERAAVVAPNAHDVELVRETIAEAAEMGLEIGLEKAGHALSGLATQLGAHAGGHVAHASAAAAVTMAGHALGGVSVALQFYGLYKLIQGLEETMTAEGSGWDVNANAYGVCEDLAAGHGDVVLNRSKEKAEVLIDNLYNAGFLQKAWGANATGANLELLLQLRALAYEWRAEVQAEARRILEPHPEMKDVLHEKPSFQVVYDTLKCTLAILTHADTPKGAKTLLFGGSLQPSLHVWREVARSLTGEPPGGCLQKFTDKSLLWVIPMGGILGSDATCLAASPPPSGELLAEGFSYYPGMRCGSKGHCTRGSGIVVNTLFEYVARMI